jgi:hypothetical protein
MAHFQQGNLKQALPLQALQVQREALGNHEDVALSLPRLSTLGAETLKCAGMRLLSLSTRLLFSAFAGRQVHLASIYQ